MCNYNFTTLPLQLRFQLHYTTPDYHYTTPHYTTTATATTTKTTTTTTLQLQLHLFPMVKSQLAQLCMMVNLTSLTGGASEVNYSSWYTFFKPMSTYIVKLCFEQFAI
jgi:hypothetical protein